MALSAITLAWLNHLGDLGVVPPGPMLELGPQDVSARRPVVDAYLRSRLGDAPAEAAVARLYGDPAPDRPQEEIYRALGLTEYVSVDFGDPRSEFQHDLNHPLDLGRRFAAVTNFGTAEHVFDVATVLRTQYRHLDVGGLALLVLPAFGEINHGFYNLHPTIWTDLAAANDMEIADFQYVDDVVGRSNRLDEEGGCRLDFGSLPVKPLDGQYGHFRQIVALAFVRNMAAHLKAAPSGQVPGYVLDCCMVALRRTAASPPELRNPQQAIYASAEASAKAQSLRPVIS